MKNEMDILKKFQRDEATAIRVYSKLAAIIKDKNNAAQLKNFAEDERGHYNTLKSFTGTEQPSNWFIAFCIVAAVRIIGITFALKLLERKERTIHHTYSPLINRHPELVAIIEDEKRHDREIEQIIKEERLEYVGSVVLGLNDALVELTGALVGLTFAFRNTRLIALSGLITGIAASLSMAASEFLSHRAESLGARAGKAALYTGITYLITVFLLIAPYLLFTQYIVALVLTLSLAIVIILMFSFYVSVTKNISFRRHFLEMTGLNLGVAGVSFFIGILVRKVLGVEI